MKDNFLDDSEIMEDETGKRRYPKDRYTKIPYTEDAGCKRFYEGLKHVKGATPFRKDCPAAYFIASVMNGNFINEDAILYSVVRTIIPKDEQGRKDYYHNEIWGKHSMGGDFVGTLRKDKALQIVNDYFRKELKSRVVSNYNITESAALTFVDCVEREFGDAVMLDYSNLKYKNPIFCELIKQRMDERYTKIEGTDIYYNDEDKLTGPVPYETQNAIRENYLKIAKNYVIRAERLVDENTTYEEFEDRLEKIEKCMNSMESKLDERHKEDYDFRDAKAALKDLMQCKDLVYAGKGRGEYAISVSKVLDKIAKKENLTKGEVATLNDFSDRLVKLDKALDVVDENERPYKANFFALMPMKLSDFMELSERFSLTNLASAEAKKAASSSQKKVKAIFRKDVEKRSYQFDVNALKKYKGKGQRLNGEIIYDYSTDEKFAGFLSEVEKSREEHNLPKLDICYDLVAEAVAYGKELVKLPDSKPKAHRRKG